MSHRVVLSLAGIAIAGLVSLPRAAQAQAEGTKKAPAAKASAAKGWAPPRTPDGKPDLSGLWQTIRTGSGQVIVGADVPPLLRTSQFWNIGAGLDGDLPLQPWAYELRNKRIADRKFQQPN